MKKIKQTVLAASTGVLLLSGCATEPGKKTAVGAGVGALVGAGVGAIIGNQSGERDKGALVGGLVGAGIGGAVGNAKEAKEKKAAAPKPPKN
ncbi:MAG: glycine zipper domain-containing protein [Verrucomicrobiota bacterium]|nr:glycine zipper domain-containing protein [Verrucomicrobiota bacterium]